MADHVVLVVDRVIRPAVIQPDTIASSPCAGVSSGANPAPSFEGVTEADDRLPLIQAAECRICQEEDSIGNLETPCACRGSLKYAHRKCVQHWCNEKKDTTCEICNQPYQPGYTCPLTPPPTEDTAIDIGGVWRITGTPLGWEDPHLIAVADGDRPFLEAEYDEYEEAANGSGAMFCRSAFLILMALLLLRHALSVTDPDEDDDTSSATFFTLFLLRAASFLLPCYIMAWAISVLQRRRQREDLAFVLQPGQRRALHLAIAPAPAVLQRQEPM